MSSATGAQRVRAKLPRVQTARPSCDAPDPATSPVLNRATMSIASVDPYGTSWTVCSIAGTAWLAKNQPYVAAEPAPVARV